MKPKVCIIKTRGTNCDEETKFAFEMAGAEADIVHLASLRYGIDPVNSRSVKLENYQIVAIPGGFSGGDYIGAGKIFAEDLKHFLGDQIEEFDSSGKPIIGICNGFQALVKYGLLPGREGVKQEVTLTYNDQGRFRCDWVRLANPVSNNCIWTRNIDQIDLPIAHGEGKFVASPGLARILISENLVPLTYANGYAMSFPFNPNGSIEDIASLCNPRGNVFGLMPHPERYLIPERHRHAHLQKVLSRSYLDDNPEVERLRMLIGALPQEGQGLQIFRNAVRYFE